MENNPLPVARIYTADAVKELHIKADAGTFSRIEDAEKAALAKADSATMDAVIIQEEDGFHVYGIDEMHPNMPVNSQAKLKSEAMVISFVSTDPITGKENFIGKQPSGKTVVNAPQGKTDLEKYADKFSRQLNKILGNEKETFLAQLIELEKKIEASGINVKIELNDDIFENKDKLNGYKNFLTYLSSNTAALTDRNIKNVAIVDEFDNWWGVKADLEYDGKTNEQTLELGDDFLDDWGESLKVFDKRSLEKITNAIGNKLSPAEITKKAEISEKLASALAKSYNRLNELQQDLLNTKNTDNLTRALEAITKEIAAISDSLPDTRKFFENLSIKNQSKISLKEFKKFEESLKQINEQLKALKDETAKPDLMTITARIEKMKIFLLKGAEEIPDKRNSVSGYISGTMNAVPGAGINFSHAFDQNHSTVASLNLGTSSFESSELILGLGVGHKLSSENSLLDGLYGSIGIGFGKDTPFFAGVSLNNSWYLNDYQTRDKDLSLVGGAYSTMGTYNNAGAYIDLHKKITDVFEIEGSGELSFLNQNLEIEAEYSLTKNKDFYITGGLGTNKLLYAGIGFAEKYELEAGLGGISFGKDSDNLPGETGWEIGMRSYLPIPYFKHHRVPGYQFTYSDQSKEYLTPDGTFMTIKKDINGNKQRTSYIPEKITENQKPEISYQIVKSDKQETEKRELSLSLLGYLTVKEGEKTIIEDGFILEKLNQAELGIITDQAGVLWFDKLKKDQQSSVSGRRKELPLPLYRAVHQ